MLNKEIIDMQLKVRIVSLLVAWTLFLSVLLVVVAVPKGSEAISLEDDAHMEGWVTSDGVTPIEGAYVKVMLMVGDGLQINNSFTDSEGYYEVGLPGGFDYAVFAAHEDYLFGMAMATVMAGETARANLTLDAIDPLDRTVTLKGVVKDEEGDPVTTGTVFGFVSGPAGPDGMPYYGNYTTPDGEGNYELKVIAGAMGGGVFLMDIPGYEMQGNETTTPFEADGVYWLNITLELPETYTECSFSGYITEAGTDIPLADVLVSVDSSNKMEGASDFNYSLTNDEGYFIVNISEGIFDIFVQKSGYSSYMEWEVGILAGEHLDMSCELLPAVATFKGNVTDAVSTDPIPYATVVIVDSHYMRSAVTDQDGYYELAAFEGEGMDLYVQTEGYSQGRAVVDVGVGDMVWHDFELYVLDATLTGKVTDAITGDPIEHAGVSAYSAEHMDWNETDGDGDYSMDLASGVYTVGASAENYGWASSTVVVDPGVNTFDIKLMPNDMPITVRLFGYVNDSVSDTPIASAEVVVYVDGTDYSAEAEADVNGYYEMMVPPLVLDMYARGKNYTPFFGSVDASGGDDSVHLDIELVSDLVSPSGTGFQTPTQNITWFNEDHIFYEIEDDNMEVIMLFMLMNYDGNKTDGNYSLVAGWAYSNNPVHPQSSLPCSVVGDVHTVDMLWDASADGGWLSSPTDDEMYVGLSDFSYYGDDFKAIGALYSNDSLLDESGSALFDPVTGDYVRFVFSNDSATGIGELDGTISPITLRLETEGGSITNLSGDSALGDWSVDGLHIEYDTFVPSGDYYSLVLAQDWGRRAWMEFTPLMVDNDPPVADAGPSRDEVVNTVVTLNGSASTDNNREYMTFLWQFDDVVPVSLSGEVVNYTFASTGEYEILLTVTDGAGHMDTDILIITVNDDAPPVADAGPDRSVPEDTQVIFNGSGSYDDVAVVNYTWTIVELDVTLYEEVCNYTFADLGVYTVRLVVNDTIDQLSDPDDAIITVVDAISPVANAGLDQLVPIGTKVLLNGSSSTDDHGVVNYTWTFTDIDDETLYGVEVAYTFITSGEHAVTLTVMDAAGNSDTDEVLITVVDNEDPEADAGPDQTVAIGEEVTFDGSGSTDNSGSIVNYTWTFEYDDKDRELFGESPVFTFEMEGEFIVMLTVEDYAGNYDSDTVTIRVNAPPVADAGSAITVTVGDEVTFDGSGSTDDSGSIENYTWTFVYDGDEWELYGVSPSFVFEVAGEYTVELTVTDAVGLTDTDEVVVTVEEADGGAGEESFLESNWWILAIIAIVVVAGAASAAMIMSSRNRKGGLVDDTAEGGPDKIDETDDLPPPPEEF